MRRATHAAMLQHRRWLRIAGLAFFLSLVSCAEGTRDITPWSRLLPSTAGQSVVAMALDAQGEPAVAGALIEGIDESFARPDGNGQGVFLSMLDSAGKGLWGGISTAQHAQARGVAIVPNGDVLLLGTFMDKINLGGEVLSTRDNASFREAMFLARFDPRGKLLWSKAIGDMLGRPVYARTLATNASGDAIVVGDFFDQPVSGTSGQVGFVVRFDDAGNQAWTTTFKEINCHIEALVVDATGSIYVGGYSFGLMNEEYLNHGTLASNAFVTKLSPQGLPIFTTRVNNSTGQDTPYINALALGSSGDLVFSGGFEDDITFGDLTFIEINSPRAFVAGLSAETGAPRWLSPIRVTFGSGEVAAVAVAPSGRVYATGQYQGDELALNGVTLGPTSGKAMFLLELDAAGKALDGRIFDHSGQLSVGRALAVDPAGALVLAGHFVGQIDLDDQSLISAPLGSSFVARLQLPFASHRRE